MSHAFAPLPGPMTTSQEVWSAAHAAGVRVCFANPGTTEMWLVDGLTRSAVRAVLCLHETACTGADDGYGRLRRVPAATLLHLGPGLENGLSNLHNARRASTPVVNLVGCMATWHKTSDPLLNMDVLGLANSVSKHVVTTCSSSSLGAEVTQACKATQGSAQAGGSRVSTVIIPHDQTWLPCASTVKEISHAAMQSDVSCALPHDQNASCSHDQAAAVQFIAACAKALESCTKGQGAIYCGGQALLQDDDCLACLGKVAAATGAALLCENAFARVDRGAGLPHFQRLPYFPQEAAKEMSKYSLLLVVDARLPVAMFGYKDGPSQLVSLPEDSVWQLDSSCISVSWALHQLTLHTKADGIVPAQNCGGVFASLSRPAMPQGKLTARSMCAVIAHLQPEGAIIVGESLTSGGAYWDLSKGCPQFSHLALTGGAIGSGPPMALGAAIACPDRPVINIQADGSAMYSLQALWSQAREQLHVITIICANRSYAILKLELARQKIPASKAAQALTDIGTPSIDWVALAQGMGLQQAVQACTSEALAAALSRALTHKGPTLIECLL